MDNVDQRNEKIQEDAFFISQEISANWDATVFLTLRPQTYYKSKLEGALTGYHPKAFTIAPPRVDEVILRRLSFAQQLASGEKKIATKKRRPTTTVVKPVLPPASTPAELST